MPRLLYCHTNGVQLHLGGFRVPPLAWRNPCHLQKLSCTICRILHMLASPSSPWIILVASTNASMLSVIRTSHRTDLMCHGVASDWYAVMRECEMRVHHMAVSPVPCPSPYQGCALECCLYCWEMPNECLGWYLVC